MRVSAGLAVIGLSGKTRIQTLPPRFIKRVSAIRAASIWRASSQTGSSACRPNSPKASVLPRWAVPFMRPRCCLRYFVRDGANNMASYLLYWLSLCTGFRLGCGRFRRLRGLRGYLLNLDLWRFRNLWRFHDGSGLAYRVFRPLRLRGLRYSGLTLRTRATLPALATLSLWTLTLGLSLWTRAALPALSLRALATLSLGLSLWGFTLCLTLRALAAFALWALATLSLPLRTRAALALRTLATLATLAFPALAALATLTALPAALTAFAALALARESWLRSEFGGFCCQALAGQHIALINPYFDTDNAKGGMRLCLAVINIGTQGMQGNFPLNLFLRAGNFRTAEATTDDNFHAFRAGTQRLLHRLLHGAAEGDTLLQLLGNTATNQGRIEFWLANLQNVQAHALVGLCLQFSAQPVHLLAAFADDNARAGRMNGDGHLVGCGPLDLNARNRGVRQLFVDHISDRVIFREYIFVVPPGKPARLPALDDAEPEPSGMYFLSQSVLLLTDTWRLPGCLKR